MMAAIAIYIPNSNSMNQIQNLISVEIEQWRNEELNVWKDEDIGQYRNVDE